MTDYVSTASPFAFDSLSFVAHYFFLLLSVALSVLSFANYRCTQINCVIERHCDESSRELNKLRVFSLAHTAHTHTHIQRAPHFASAALFQFQILICFFFVRQWISNKILFYLLWLFIALRYWTMKLVVLNFCICLFVVPQWSTINIH